MEESKSRKEERYPDVFNDVFGPVMRPFSSSHTAAPCRIGYAASALVPVERLSKIRIEMDPEGSFLYSVRMQHLDNALLSGATGHLPDDILMFSVKDYLKEQGIAFELAAVPIPEAGGLAAAKLILTDKSGREEILVGESIGGGVIEVQNINGYPMRDRSENYVILIEDGDEALSADQVFERLSATYTVIEQKINRKPEPESSGQLLQIRVEEEITEGMERKLRLLYPEQRVFVLRPSQHVQFRKNRGPRVFGSFAEWKEKAANENKTLAEVVLDYEEQSSLWSREQILFRFRDVIIRNMHRTTHLIYDDESYREFVDGPVKRTNLFESNDVQMARHYKTDGHGIWGNVIARATAYAGGAGLGLPEFIFIPGPMGMGGSLLYSALSAVQEENHLSDDAVLDGVLVAAGICLLAFINAHPGGTGMGCAGEQGICGAMTAAAVAAACGGTADQIENAASFFLQLSVGWPCDPQPGCKGQPCKARVDATIAMGLFYAEKALLGGDAVFPFDEVLQVAYDVGKTTLGGGIHRAHGACPTAQRRAKLYQEPDGKQEAE